MTRNHLGAIQYGQWLMRALLLAPIGILPASTSAATIPSASKPLIDHQSFTLGNGLKVIVHEDRKAPVVTVQVIYRVGSLDEPDGQHGYAHLFEHLMFEGSAHHDRSYFTTLREMGASEYNGVTNLDRTVYYETVPRAALDQALFLESDRMGHLLGALTRQKLDNQVEVVLNEKRQGEDRPYGTVWEPIFADLYPADHPYHHSTIGTEKDLRAATLDDVRAWFRRYYGAGNAALVLTGDIDAEEARRLAQRYFGAIDGGPPRARPIADSPPLPAPVRRFMEARVAAPRLYRHYITPPMGGAGDAPLELMIQILGNGLASRLRHRLVDELGIAHAATVTFGENMLSGQVGVIVDPVSADRLPQVARELDAVFATFAATGPTAQELKRARTVRLATLSRFLESSFGQSIMLARGELFADDPGFYVGRHLDLLRTATRDDVRRSAAAILRNGYSELTVLPVPPRRAASVDVDRAAGMPARAAAASVRAPLVQEARLANGIRVVYVERGPAAPVEIVSQFDANAATDPATPDGRPGLRAAAMALLERGAGVRDAVAMVHAQEEIGGSMSTAVTPDVTRVRLSMFAERIDEGAALLADAIMRPRYAPQEVERYRRERLAALEQERTVLGASGERVARWVLYGPDHPYGARSIADDAAAVRSLTADDLRRWHTQWMRPERLTLFVGAGVPLARLLPALERTLGRWHPAGAPMEVPAIPTAPPPARGGRTILVDVPGAQQAQIFAARLIGPTGGADDDAVAVANEVFGGNPSARINTSLRSVKGWSYGIGSGAADSRGERMMIVAGPVQSDRAGDSITELRAQMRAIGGDKPPTATELARVVDATAGAVGGKLETTDAVVADIARAAVFGRAPDHAFTAAQRYRALTPADLAVPARRIFDPDAMLWIVVGDAATIRPQLAAISPGGVEVRRAGD